MNFFEHQARARRASTRLMILFTLAVIGIVIAVDMVVVVLLGFDNIRGESVGWMPLLACSVITLMVIGLGSLYRIASLRGGGEPVARQLGGVPVPEDTTDFNLRRLRNVVEEIAIASGVPVPRLYVLEQDTAINAFAAGYSPSDAVIAVTRGALDRLNRDELQGVIAHEFSHVRNGDMRLNIRLIGVLFGILMLAIIGRKVFEISGRTRSSKGTLPILLIALVTMLIGYVGLFFGRMIKAGISRSRESLADASAVQFTRQTQGLAGALKKIGGLGAGSKLADRGNAEEVSHMLFGDGIGFSGLFATHPPLLRRIQALEPHFKAEQLQTLRGRWLQTPPNGLEEDVHLGLAASTDATLPSAARSFAVTPPMVVAQVATPAADDYARADAIVTGIPDALRDLAARRDSVMPLLLGLLLATEDALQVRQQSEVATRLGADVAAHALRIHQQLTADLHPSLRLPLAALAFPVLRMRPRPELDAFIETVTAVSEADGQVSLFEYCLGRLLRVQVRESLEPARHARFGRKRLVQVRDQIATLLATVAASGSMDAQEARRAYLSGMQRVLPDAHVAYRAPAAGVLALDAVWEPLDALDPLAKQALVEGLTAAISHDGRIVVAEAELLRTICSVLHCPLPPMLERA